MTSAPPPSVSLCMGWDLRAPRTYVCEQKTFNGSSEWLNFPHAARQQFNLLALGALDEGSPLSLLPPSMLALAALKADYSDSWTALTLPDFSEAAFNPCLNP